MVIGVRKDWDLFFKWMTTSSLASHQDIEIEEEKPLGRHPFRVDVLAKVKRLEVIPSYQGHLGPLVRRWKHYNYLEFKSITDDVRKGLIKRLIGHFGYHAEKEDMSWKIWRYEITGQLILARNIEVILSDLEEGDVNVKNPERGIYEINDPWNISLFDLQELKLDFETVPLIFLAGQERFIEALEYSLDHFEQLNIFISAAYWIYPEKVKMMQEARQVVFEPQIKKAIELLGISRVIEEVGLARVIEEVGLKHVVQEIVKNKKWLARLVENGKITEEERQILVTLLKKIEK